mgnify:CR=1 FL=1
MTILEENAIISSPLMEGSFFVHLCAIGLFREGGTGKSQIHGCVYPNVQEVPNMRVKITLACSECKQRNYDTKKNKKNDPDRLEMNKYCRFCRKHTLHKETK